MKQGVKSSEFWMSLFAAAVMVANEGLGLGIPAESVMSLAGVAVSYVIGRSAVKAKASPA